MEEIDIDTDSSEKGTQYNLNDTTVPFSFSPRTSSTIKEDGSEEAIEDLEDYISVTKSRGIQTASFSEEATQTDETQFSDISELSSSMAILANRFLHASYWFLTLSAIFAKENLVSMKNNIEMRQSVTKGAAKRILANLATHDRVLLADISKPDFEYKDFSPASAVKIIGELDDWLLSSVEICQFSAQIKGAEEQAKLLEELKEDQNILAKESQIMNSKKLFSI